MKTISGVLILIFCISVLFGCEQDSNEIMPDNSLWVYVDGAIWKSDTVYVNYTASTNTTVITANHGNDNEQINLSFLGNTVGNYSFSSGEEPRFGNYFRNSTNELYWSSSTTKPFGNIIVTEYDHYNHWLSGSFYFDAYDSIGTKKVLTSGKFNKLTFSN